MSQFFATYQSLFDHILVFAILAMSQYVVLRAGVFSLGSAGLAALGAYGCSLLIVKLGWPPAGAIAAGALLGTVAGALLALPLARLRGVYQSIGTLTVVQIVLSVTQNWNEVTNGALGVTGIPKVAGTGVLLLSAAACTALLLALGAHGIGRAWDVIREDETVAVSLGISVPAYHRVAFTLSGFLAGLGGALYATNSYAITPTEFGFGMVVTLLAMVVLGGRTSVWGALAGAAILTSLPELFRIFADYRNVVQGILLVLVIVYLPRGVADTLLAFWRDRQRRRRTEAAPAGDASGSIRVEAGGRP